LDNELKDYDFTDRNLLRQLNGSLVLLYPIGGESLDKVINARSKFIARNLHFSSRFFVFEMKIFTLSTIF